MNQKQKLEYILSEYKMRDYISDFIDKFDKQSVKKVDGNKRNNIWYGILVEYECRHFLHNGLTIKKTIKSQPDFDEVRYFVFSNKYQLKERFYDKQYVKDYVFDLIFE